MSKVLPQLEHRLSLQIRPGNAAQTTRKWCKIWTEIPSGRLGGMKINITTDVGTGDVWDNR